MINKRLETKIGISLYYYNLVLILAILNFVYLPLKVGIISDFIMLYMAIKENLITKLRIKPFFFFYVFWILLSYIWMGADRLSGMVTSFGYSILPMLFFIVGRKLTFVERKKYIDTIITSIRIMLVLSVILWFFMPDFYCKYLINKTWVGNKNLSIAKVEARMCMQGISGATATGFFCAVLFLADLKKILWCKLTKLSIVFIFLDVFFLIANSRKSAMLGAFFIMIMEIVNYIKNKPRFSIRLIILLFVTILFCLFFYCVCLYIHFDFNFFKNMLDRFSNTELEKAFTVRANDNESALINMKNYMYFFGNGFGSSGHKADLSTGIYIYDNNWMLIFVETGIIGLLLFILAIIENVNKVLINKRYFSLEFYIVCLVLLQSITSNMLENQFITPLFYFSLGCCSAWKLCTTKGEIYE